MLSGDLRVRAYVSSFSVQKEGNAPEENEDACCPAQGREVNARAFRVAISDGSTEGLLSGQWSTLLVRTFCKLQTSSIERIVQVAQIEWSSFLREYLKDRAEHNPVQWYEEPGLDKGAFGSLLGLHLNTRTARGGRKSWSAMAVGDSCLFQVRKDELVARFPVECARDFNSSPMLIPSNPALLDNALRYGVKLQSGHWRCGDSFYLATDALSGWFLLEVEQRRKPWQVLTDFDTRDQVTDFADWVSELRRSGRMKNDDVTLLRIDVY
jgi:hypothetical protein